MPEEEARVLALAVFQSAGLPDCYENGDWCRVSSPCRYQC